MTGRIPEFAAAKRSVGYVLKTPKEVPVLRAYEGQRLAGSGFNGQQEQIDALEDHEDLLAAEVVLDDAASLR